MENRKIDVDDAVWEMLKKNAQANGETPNDILKRLLANKDNAEAEKKPEKENTGKDWSCF